MANSREPSVNPPQKMDIHPSDYDEGVTARTIPLSSQNRSQSRTASIISTGMNKRTMNFSTVSQKNPFSSERKQKHFENSINLSKRFSHNIYKTILEPSESGLNIHTRHGSLFTKSYTDQFVSYKKEKLPPLLVNKIVTHALEEYKMNEREDFHSLNELIFKARYLYNAFAHQKKSQQPTQDLSLLLRTLRQLIDFIIRKLKEQKEKNNIDPSIFAVGMTGLTSLINQYIKISTKEELFGNLGKIKELLIQNNRSVYASWAQRPLLPQKNISKKKFYFFVVALERKHSRIRRFYMEEIDYLLSMSQCLYKIGANKSKAKVQYQEGLTAIEPAPSIVSRNRFSVPQNIRKYRHFENQSQINLNRAPSIITNNGHLSQYRKKSSPVVGIEGENFSVPQLMSVSSNSSVKPKLISNSGKFFSQQNHHFNTNLKLDLGQENYISYTHSSPKNSSLLSSNLSSHRHRNLKSRTLKFKSRTNLNGGNILTNFDIKKNVIKKFQNKNSSKKAYLQRKSPGLNEFKTRKLKLGFNKSSMLFKPHHFTQKQKLSQLNSSREKLTAQSQQYPIGGKVHSQKHHGSKIREILRRPVFGQSQNRMNLTTHNQKSSNLVPFNGIKGNKKKSHKHKRNIANHTLVSNLSHQIDNATNLSKTTHINSNLYALSKSNESSRMSGYSYLNQVRNRIKQYKNHQQPNSHSIKVKQALHSPQKYKGYKNYKKLNQAKNGYQPVRKSHHTKTNFEGKMFKTAYSSSKKPITPQQRNLYNSLLM